MIELNHLLETTCFTQNSILYFSKQKRPSIEGPFLYRKLVLRQLLLCSVQMVKYEKRRGLA